MATSVTSQQRGDEFSTSGLEPQISQRYSPRHALDSWLAEPITTAENFFLKDFNNKSAIDQPQPSIAFLACDRSTVGSFQTLYPSAIVERIEEEPDISIGGPSNQHIRKEERIPGGLNLRKRHAEGVSDAIPKSSIPKANGRYRQGYPSTIGSSSGSYYSAALSQQVSSSKSYLSIPSQSAVEDHGHGAINAEISQLCDCLFCGDRSTEPIQEPTITCPVTKHSEEMDSACEFNQSMYKDSLEIYDLLFNLPPPLGYNLDFTDLLDDVDIRRETELLQAPTCVTCRIPNIFVVVGYSRVDGNQPTSTTRPSAPMHHEQPTTSTEHYAIEIHNDSPTSCQSHETRKTPLTLSKIGLWGGLLIGTPTVTFAPWWLYKHPDDLQNAFVPTGLIATIFFFYVTVQLMLSFGKAG